jgi:hypothetical protein
MQTEQTPLEYFVYEAEYENETGARRADWTKPVADTVHWHGPYPTEAEADEQARSRAWAQIDKCYHRVAITLSRLFDPRNPATHDFVVNPDLYWDRK